MKLTIDQCRAISWAVEEAVTRGYTRDADLLRTVLTEARDEFHATAQPKAAAPDLDAAMAALGEKYAEPTGKPRYDWLSPTSVDRADLEAEGITPAPQDTVTLNELHPDTVKLVRRFARAIAAKLLSAQRKYGMGNGWLADDWQDKCRADLMSHIAKGDPRDVAAYCAFMWHHDWSTAAPPAPIASAEEAEPSGSLRLRNMTLEEAARRVENQFGLGTVADDVRSMKFERSSQEDLSSADDYGNLPEEAVYLADEEIDIIAESMPGGIDGFLKGWGWRNFARAIEAEVLLTHPAAAQPGEPT